MIRKDNHLFPQYRVVLAASYITIGMFTASVLYGGLLAFNVAPNWLVRVHNKLTTPGGLERIA